MRTTAFVSFILVNSNAFALNDYDLSRSYMEVLKEKHLNGNVQNARKLAQDQLQRLPNDSEIANNFAAEAYEERDGLPQLLIAKVKFLEGTKKEVYCKNLGLVHMEGNHQDGTKSSLRIRDYAIIGQSGDYATRTAGNWVFELTNGYRRNTPSNVVLVSGTSNSYELLEMRRHGQGEIDVGDYKFRLEGEKEKHNYHTRGEVLEPWPMYMATDFQLWGSPDLGLKLKFFPGYKDVNESTQSGNGYRIFLRSERKVGNHLATYSFVDSTGGSSSFEDCFPVETKISFLKATKRK